MGCLYGQMMNFVRGKYKDDDDFQDCADWNLLVFDIAFWMFRRSPESQIQWYPFIPDDGETVWGAWFGKVVDALSREFNAATRGLVYSCLKDCPHEDVAMIVFDTIEFNDIKEYLVENGGSVTLL